MRERVMPVSKQVLSRDNDRWLRCCWDDCDNQGYELHKTRFHDHPRGTACDFPDAKHLWYVFCTDRHRMFFLNSHRANGMLPAGAKLSLV
jgi:hypothetical protein